MQRNRLEVVGYLAPSPRSDTFLPEHPSRMSVSEKATDTRTERANRNNTPIGTTYRSMAIFLALRRPSRKATTFSSRAQSSSASSHRRADGVQRIVHEVVVRNCHLIAAPRGAAAKAAVVTTSEEPPIPDLQKGATDHDGWPVG